MYKVLVLEDDTEVRQHIELVISNSLDFELTLSCATLADTSAQLSLSNIDIALVDLGLPDGFGGDFIRNCAEESPNIRSLVLSGFQDEQNVFKALESGALGYILKHDSAFNIETAMIEVMKGGSPMSPQIARMVLKRFIAPEEQIEHPDPLTDKQNQILKYISQGFTSKEIAQKLKISYHTVTTHIKSIYEKLQVNSRTEALYEAHKIGIL